MLAKDSFFPFGLNKRARIYRSGNRNEQSRETGNIGYTRRRQTKQTHNTICVGHKSPQTNTIKGFRLEKCIT
jgi:hypothetical protein